MCSIKLILHLKGINENWILCRYFWIPAIIFVIITNYIETIAVINFYYITTLITLTMPFYGFSKLYTKVSYKYRNNKYGIFRYIVSILLIYK